MLPVGAHFLRAANAIGGFTWGRYDGGFIAGEALRWMRGASAAVIF
jgi:hypothetical protein